MEQNQIREWMREGIEAARNNNKIIARDFFRRVLEVDPNNELAWMWMAQSVDRVSERRQALERVLEINPRNERALAAIARMTEESGYTPSASGARMSDSVSSAMRTNDQNAADASRQSVEVERDWLRPVSRENMPSELWSKNRRQNNNLLLYLLGGVAIALIGFGVFLLLGYLEDDSDSSDEQPTPVLSAADIQATSDVLALTPPSTPVPPTNTLLPTSIFALTPTSTGLPPTLAPTLTNTPQATNTPTPGPTNPDIFRIVYAASSAPGEPARLYSANGDGSDPQFLLFTLDGVPIREVASADDERRIEFLDPALSPAGEFIAFTMEIDGIQEIYVAPDGGGEVFQITLTNTNETRGAAWHPNGEIIAYYSNADGDFDIYTVPLSQEEPTNITQNDADDRHPSWSPDGQYMAIASDRNSRGSLEIFVINISGQITPPDAFGRTPFSGECQLTDAAGDSFSPAWSPNAQQIAFITTREGDNDLYIMQADGTNERILSVPDNIVDWQERNPAWSPDGSWILVSSNRLPVVGETGINATYKLWLTTPRGDIWRQLTEGDSNEIGGVWFAVLPEFRPDVSNFSYTCVG